MAHHIMCRTIPVFFLLFTTSVFAHESLTGWTYPEECCGGEDCRVAAEGELVYTTRGWWVATTHEYIPEDDQRIRRSRDQLSHICIAQIMPDYTPMPHATCVFLPDAKF